MDGGIRVRGVCEWSWFEKTARTMQNRAGKLKLEIFPASVVAQLSV
jgi:hypothetical protein